MKNRTPRSLWLLLLLLVPVLLVMTGCGSDNDGGNDGPVPTIGSLSPAIGVPGETVTIDGANFGDDPLSGRVVLPQGLAATDVTKWSDSEIEFTIPDGSLSGCVQVTVGEVASNCAEFNAFSGKCEGFESDGLDTAVWQVFGTKAPELHDSGKDSAWSLDIRGDATCASGLYTVGTYLTNQYLLASFNIQGTTVEKPTCMKIRAGFTGGVSSDATCQTATVELYDEIAWVSMDLSADSPKIRYETLSGEFYEEPYPDDEWHEFSITLNENGTVSFYREGIRRFTSKEVLDFSAYPATRFQVRGQACDGAILVDNMCIDGVESEETGWISRQPMPTARSGAGAAVVDTGVFIIGGKAADTPLTVVERYDSVADSWSTEFSTGAAWAPLPETVTEFATGVLDGKIYLIGGVVSGVSSAKTLVMDPAANTWTETGALPEPRHSAAAAVIGGNIYLFGGRSIDSAGAQTLHASVFKFDPAAGAWSAVSDLPEARADQGVCTIDGIAHLVSGTIARETAPSGLTNTVLRVDDPDLATYTAIAQLPVPTLHPGCFEVGPRLVVLNGHTPSDTAQREAFYHDGVKDTWARLVSYTGEKYRPAMAVVENTLYVFGGRNKDGEALPETLSLTLTGTGWTDNTPPLAQAQSVTTKKNTAVTISLSATDAENDTLTYTVGTQPQNGALTGTAPAMTYTPATDFLGTDTFTFKANDGTVDSEEATVTITVNETGTPPPEPGPTPDPDNQPPVIEEGESKTVTMSEDGNPDPFSLTLNASDAEGDEITWSLKTEAAHGKAEAAGTGTSIQIGYEPASDWFGDDSFVVEVSDSAGGTDSITVNVQVEDEVDVPIL